MGPPNPVLQGSGVNGKRRAWEGRRARRADEAAVEAGARWHRALRAGERVTFLLWAMGSLSELEAEDGQGHLSSSYHLYYDTF